MEASSFSRYLAPQLILSNVRLQRRLRFGMAGLPGLSHLCTAVLLVLLCFFTCPSSAVLIPSFRNCLDPDVINSPTHLQFQPLAVDVFLDNRPGHLINLTIYGNVTGSSADNPAGTKRWLVASGGGLEEHAVEDPWLPGKFRLVRGQLEPGQAQAGPFRKREQYAVTGQIIDHLPTWDRLTTLRSTFNVLTFRPLNNYSSFCSHVNSCPMSAVLNVTEAQYLTNPNLLPSFDVSVGLKESYSFTSVIGTFRIISGDSQQTPIGCIRVEVTPPLGNRNSKAVRYLPLAILLFVGIATVSAAILNPWNGTKDIFRWSTNFGMDDDMLRLVTPGFGDCLQYIQFVVLTGSLTLSYPGFFQPIVSQSAWSILLFNNTLVSGGGSVSRLVDGIYAPNATYGLERTSQLVGIRDAQDIWPVAMTYLAGIVAAAVILIQFGFMARWVFMKVKAVQEEDLRAKNLPFTLGNIVRIFYNYVLNPFAALTTFQCIIAGRSPSLSVGLAAVVIFIFLLITVFILYRIATYHPRSALTDDLSPLLLYGSLYNTYKLDATYFSMIQVSINILQAISFGALQPSGLAQLILLAVCEVVLILTLNAVRPYSPRTSMNLYQTFFSGTRLVAILFSFTFVPILDIDEATKGWVGYAVLLMHAIVLLFGFFLNALQTVVEIVARLLGAGSDNGTAARGGLAQVFSKRQLSRRRDRPELADPHQNRQRADSSPSVLGSDGRKSTYTGVGRGRPHSRSNSSAMLLGRNGEPGSVTLSDGPGILGILDTSSGGGRGHRHTGSVSTSGYTPTSPIATTYGSTSVPATSGGAIVGLSVLGGGSDPGPYYRPPRVRTNASGVITVGDSPAKSRGSFGSGDWGAKLDNASNPPKSAHGEQGSISGFRGTNGQGRPYSEGDWDAPTAVNTNPNSDSGTPPVFANRHTNTDSSFPSPANTRTDYTVRETDFYLNLRGRALSSSAPSRRLGTGPADPTGPISVAKGWLSRKLGRSKDKGKGFEVVRSARATEIRREIEEAAERRRRQEGERAAATAAAAETRDSLSSDSSHDERVTSQQHPQDRRDESDSDSSNDEGYQPRPPESGEQSRRKLPRSNATALEDDGTPALPRKSSKRKTATLLVKPSPHASASSSPALLPTQASTVPTPTRHVELYDPPLPPLKTHSRNSSLTYEPQSPVHQHSPHHQHYRNASHNHSPHSSLLQPGAASSPSSRLPFSSPSPRNSLLPDEPSTGNSRSSSTASSVLSPPPGIGGQDKDGAGSRPASVGTVNRHRMEDSLRSGLSEEMLGRESAGEFGMVGDRAGSMSSRRRESKVSGASNASRASNRSSKR